jgi:hypothetical protein
MLVIRISSRIGHIKIQGTQHVQKNIPACTLFVFFFLFSWRNLLWTPLRSGAARNLVLCGGCIYPEIASPAYSRSPVMPR